MPETYRGLYGDIVAYSCAIRMLVVKLWWGFEFKVHYNT